MPLPPVQGPPTWKTWARQRIREALKRRRERPQPVGLSQTEGFLLAVLGVVLYAFAAKRAASSSSAKPDKSGRAHHPPARGIRPGQLPAQRIASSGDGAPYK